MSEATNFDLTEAREAHKSSSENIESSDKVENAKEAKDAITQPKAIKADALIKEVKKVVIQSKETMAKFANNEINSTIESEINAAGEDAIKVLIKVMNRTIEAKEDSREAVIKEAIEEFKDAIHSTMLEAGYKMMDNTYEVIDCVVDEATISAYRTCGATSDARFRASMDAFYYAMEASMEASMKSAMEDAMKNTVKTTIETLNEAFTSITIGMKAAMQGAMDDAMKTSTANASYDAIIAKIEADQAALEAGGNTDSK